MVRTLYKADDSPPARAAVMVLELLRLPVELKNLNLFAKQHFTEEYLKLNPQHTIPTLVDDDFVIWDSHAIAAYLVTKYAPDDSLYPKDPRKRALVDQRLHFDSGILFPAVKSTVGPVLFKGETSIPKERFDEILIAYQFLNTFLEGRTFLTGEQLTIADICAVANVGSLHDLLPIDNRKFPNVLRWLKRMTTEDFCAKINVPGVAALGALVKKNLA